MLSKNEHKGTCAQGDCSADGGYDNWKIESGCLFDGREWCCRTVEWWKIWEFFFRRFCGSRFFFSTKAFSLFFSLNTSALGFRSKGFLGLLGFETGGFKIGFCLLLCLF